MLGLQVLAWGNSISDLLACRALAKEGHAKMAISGCYGEPIFNRLFGLPNTAIAVQMAMHSC